MAVIHENFLVGGLYYISEPVARARHKTFGGRIKPRVVHP